MDDRETPDGTDATSIELSFRIGDVFPASSPVARYVAGVAMISNDWGRLFRMQEQLTGNHPGPAFLLYRIQIGLHLEAVEFLLQAERQYEQEIGGFLERLPDEAQQIHTRLLDPADLASVRGLTVRNLSFHYPQIQRDRFDRGIEEMAQLLTGAAHLVGSVEASAEPGFLEHHFADEVTLQMLPQDDDRHFDEKAIEAFRERALAFRRFSELVVNQYVDGRPSDDLDLVDG